MHDEKLTELSRLAGLATEWMDYRGETRTVAPDTLRAILAALDLPAQSSSDLDASLAGMRDDGRAPKFITGGAGERIRLPLPWAKAELILENGERMRLPCAEEGGEALLTLPEVTGYHRLQLDGAGIGLAVAPPRAWAIEDAVGKGEGRIWGSAAQIYSLNRGNKAFGDLGDVAMLATDLGAMGADLLALSPTHALFAALPEDFGPYSPSTRLFINPLCIPLENGAADNAGALDRPADDPSGRAGALIDWRSGAVEKMARLRQEYAAFARSPAPGEFNGFVAAGGPDLLAHARFEALHLRMLDAAGADWRKWPEPQRSYRPDDGNWDGSIADEVRFHLYLQWRADGALADAQRKAGQAGMRIGLVTDMAVGLNPAGSQSWSSAADLLTGITIGAPPDLMNELGQSWGLAALSPRALARTGFKSFLATLRRAMRHAGGVRIDHALGLKRLWVVPPGASPLEGTYLANPFADLLRLICLESRRHKAIVIAEDLGNVPPGFQAILAGHGMLGMRPLWFERDQDGRVKAAEDWDRETVALTTTHDLPTVAGWWSGTDLAWRRRLFPGLDFEKAERERSADRSLFWQALGDGPEPPASDNTDPVVDGAVSIIARTASQVAVVPLEDLLGLREQPNVPGTVDTHPNWRRRLPPGNGLHAPAVKKRVDILARARPRP